MIIVVFQSNEEIIYYSRNDTESIRYSFARTFSFLLCSIPKNTFQVIKEFNIKKNFFFIVRTFNIDLVFKEISECTVRCW